MLSRCSVLLCCMCFTAALTLASNCPKLELRGAEDARACPLGSTLAATGATCSGNRAGIMCLHYLTKNQAALRIDVIGNSGTAWFLGLGAVYTCSVRALALGTGIHQALMQLRTPLHALIC